MKSLLKKTLVAAAILGGISPVAALADNTAIFQERTSEFVSVIGSYILPDPVGRIEGRDISKQELNSFLSLTQGVEINEVNDSFIAMQLLRQRGGTEALSIEARARGLDQDKDYQIKMQLIAQELLIELLHRDMIAKNDLDIEAVKAEYKQSFQDADQYEYSVSQILVETETDAQAIIDRINRKEVTFAEAARAANNLPEDDHYDGSLGDWFTESMIDADFGKAMKVLKKGEMTSSPVQTEYGYHVILLDDVREVEQTPFDSLDAEMIYRLTQPAFAQYKETVQERVKVELPETK